MDNNNNNEHIAISIINLSCPEIKEKILSHQFFCWFIDNVHNKEYSKCMIELLNKTKYLKRCLDCRIIREESIIKTTDKTWYLVDFKLTENTAEPNCLRKSILSKISWLMEIERKYIQMYKCNQCNKYLMSEEMIEHGKIGGCKYCTRYLIQTGSNYMDVLKSHITFIGKQQHTVRSLLALGRENKINKTIEDIFTKSSIKIDNGLLNVNTLHHGHTLDIEEIIRERDFEMSEDEDISDNEQYNNYPEGNENLNSYENVDDLWDYDLSDN